jgi:hypothetical protein
MKLPVEGPGLGKILSASDVYEARAHDIVAGLRECKVVSIPVGPLIPLYRPSESAHRIKVYEFRAMCGGGQVCIVCEDLVVDSWPTWAAPDVILSD